MGGAHGARRRQRCTSTNTSPWLCPRTTTRHSWSFLYLLFLFRFSCCLSQTYGRITVDRVKTPFRWAGYTVCDVRGTVDKARCRTPYAHAAAFKSHPCLVMFCMPLGREMLGLLGPARGGYTSSGSGGGGAAVAAVGWDVLDDSLMGSRQHLCAPQVDYVIPPLFLLTFLVFARVPCLQLHAIVECTSSSHHCHTHLPCSSPPTPHTWVRGRCCSSSCSPPCSCWRKTGPASPSASASARYLPISPVTSIATVDR